MPRRGEYKEPTVPTTMRLGVFSVKKRLEKFATRSGLSQTTIVNVALHLFLDEIEQNDKMAQNIIQIGKGVEEGAASLDSEPINVDSGDIL